MVLKNILEEKELTDILGFPQKRDELLMDRFSFTSDQLEAIRSPRRAYERVDLAARLLIENIRHDKLVAPMDESAQITTMTLAAIIEKDWQKRNRHYNKASKAINLIKGTQNEQGRLKPPKIHFLRKKLGTYKGNLPQASKIYKRFRASSFDWQNSIYLPLDLGMDECMLLGVLGFASNKPSSHSGLIRLSMKKLGRKGKQDPNYLYLQAVSGLIRDQYNIVAEPKIDEKPIDFENGIETNQKKVLDCIGFLDNGPVISHYRVPYLQFSSKAVKSWIIDDLGLGGDQEKVFKVFTRYSQKVGLFSGGLSRTNLRFRDGNAVFSLRLDNPFYMSMMAGLGADLGYSIAPPSPRRLIIQNRRMTWDLFRMGCYLHNEHRKEMGDYHQPNIPFWELGQETLGGRIRYLRNKAHLSQQRFADLFEVTAKSIENWEADKSIPRKESISKLAMYFGLPKDRLFQERES